VVRWDGESTTSATSGRRGAELASVKERTCRTLPYHADFSEGFFFFLQVKRT
jgi:hypothetical protein